MEWCLSDKPLTRKGSDESGRKLAGLCRMIFPSRRPVVIRVPSKEMGIGHILSLSFMAGPVMARVDVSRNKMRTICDSSYEFAAASQAKDSSAMYLVRARSAIQRAGTQWIQRNFLFRSCPILSNMVKLLTAVGPRKRSIGHPRHACDGHAR